MNLNINNIGTLWPEVLNPVGADIAQLHDIFPVALFKLLNKKLTFGDKLALVPGSFNNFSNKFLSFHSGGIVLSMQENHANLLGQSNEGISLTTSFSGLVALLTLSSRLLFVFVFHFQDLESCLRDSCLGCEAF